MTAGKNKQYNNMGILYFFPLLNSFHTMRMRNNWMDVAQGAVALVAPQGAMIPHSNDPYYNCTIGQSYSIAVVQADLPQSFTDFKFVDAEPVGSSIHT